MITGCLELGENKISEFRKEALELLKMNKVSARLLAKVTGKLISFTHSLGDVCRLRSRYLHFQIMNRLSWDGYLEMSQDCREELVFWYNNISLMSFQPMLKLEFIGSINLYVDASSHSCGGYCIESKGQCVCEWSQKANLFLGRPLWEINITGNTTFGMNFNHCMSIQYWEPQPKTL